MSGAQPIEEFRKSLEEASRQVGLELQEAQRSRIDPNSLDERSKVVTECLETAKNYYKKKEYARAFMEWERACAALGGGEEFRAKIRALRESHENLSKAARELIEIKQVLNQRAAPSGADVKFVDSAHEGVNGQVKNVYSYLSQQLRAARTPRVISFWWPVGAALLVLAGGFLVLKTYHSQEMKKISTFAPVPAAAAPQAPASSVDDAFLQAQKNAMEKQVEALKESHGQELEDLRRKHAESAKDDREKVVQLETGLREAESRNMELERRIEALAEDNLSKDRTIDSLT